MIESVKKEKPEHLLFVIDTNRYAGEFEREMCAYATGQIGECGVGRVEAEKAKKEISAEVESLEAIIRLVSDEHGCHRPVGVFPNPKYRNAGHEKYALLTKNNQKRYSYPAYFSVAIYFDKKPSNELIKIIKERAQKFADDQDPVIKIENFRFLEKYTTFKEVKI